jgi:hypothetical protein
MVLNQKESVFIGMSKKGNNGASDKVDWTKLVIVLDVDTPTLILKHELVFGGINVFSLFFMSRDRNDAFQVFKDAWFLSLFFENCADDDSLASGDQIEDIINEFCLSFVPAKLSCLNESRLEEQQSLIVHCIELQHFTSFWFDLA